MTTDRKHKKATRARAEVAGVSYLAARRAETPPETGAPCAHTVAGEVAELFWSLGWPVVTEPWPQNGARLLYAGPVRVAVTDPAIDPDQGPAPGDEDVPVPQVPAGEVWLRAPALDTGPGGLDQELPAGASAAAIVTAAEVGLARARAAALAAARAARDCTICGERFAAHHLLGPTPSQDLLACPACVFDGDLTVFYADPPGLAFQLDQLLDSNLGAPAAWAAVAALRAVGAGDGLHERLERAWRDGGTLFTPVERWVDLDHNWIWLPDPRRRPTWMAGLGPGARPSALVEALHTAHPQLREDFVTELHAGYLAALAALDEEDGEQSAAPDADTLALGWRLAVTYAVALSTDTADHPERGDPWHALCSFDSLDEHLSGLGYPGDDLLLIAMIGAGVAVLREHDLIVT